MKSFLSATNIGTRSEQFHHIYSQDSPPDLSIAMNTKVGKVKP